MGENSTLWTFTILVAGQKGETEVVASYEVIAPDAAAAARLIKADMAARGETLTEVDRAETAPVLNPLAKEGVRFRTARA